jgi:hypothetical protein
MVIVDMLTINFLELKEKVFFNKIKRRIDNIIQMEEALVLQEHGMDVIGHKDPIPYGK